MLRVPRSSAVADPDHMLPPDATIPTIAYCDAPVNTSRLSTQVCQTVKPDAAPIAPNDTPYAAVAVATPMLSARTRR